MNFIYSKDFYKYFFQTSFKAFIEQQKEDHARQLEAEKQARESNSKNNINNISSSIKKQTTATISSTT